MVSEQAVFMSRCEGEPEPPGLDHPCHGTTVWHSVSGTHRKWGGHSMIPLGRCLRGSSRLDQPGLVQVSGSEALYEGKICSMGGKLGSEGNPAKVLIFSQKEGTHGESPTLVTVRQSSPRLYRADSLEAVSEKLNPVLASA